MAKVNVADIVSKAQALYGKDIKGAAMLSTGASIVRPTKPEQFVLAPKDHPWFALTALLGIPYDSIVQVAGAYDSGKSTLAGEFMAEAQRNGVYVILGDSEKKFDKVRYDKHFGGDSKNLLIVQSTTIRKLAGGIIKYINTIMAADPTAKVFAVHDSVGGSVSRARAEKNIDDEKANQPGSEAVENSDYMKHIVAMMDKYPGRIALLLINQMTDKIGFGQKGQSRSGGHKISFHSSMILEMKKIKTITKKINKITVKTGIISRVKIDKNHLSQTDNSVAEMNVLVDTKGWHPTEFSFEKEGDDNGEAEG